MKNIDVFVFHGYDHGNGVMLTEIESIIRGSVNVIYKNNEGGKENFIDEDIVDVEGSDNGEEVHEESNDDNNVERNIVFNDKDNDYYFDDNVEANVEESILINIDAMVRNEEKKGNQVETKATKQCDKGDKKMDSNQD